MYAFRTQTQARTHTHIHTNMCMEKGQKENSNASITEAIFNPAERIDTTQQQHSTNTHIHVHTYIYMHLASCIVNLFLYAQAVSTHCCTVADSCCRSVVAPDLITNTHIYIHTYFSVYAHKGKCRSEVILDTDIREREKV